MNILFDVNVILDALLDRKPYGKEAALLISAVEESAVTGFLCADSVTTLFYLISKFRNKKHAKQEIKLLLELFEIAPINRAVLQEAMETDFTDFEDAVVHQSAFLTNCDGIVTRNAKDFKSSKVSIYNPRELLNAMNCKG